MKHQPWSQRKLMQMCLGMLLLLSLSRSLVMAQPEEENEPKNENDGTKENTPSSSNGNEDNADKPMSFGMVSGDSAFFEPIKAGWLHECATRNVTCHYLPVNYTFYFEEQADLYSHPCVPLMLDLIEMGVDGISAACKFEDVTPWQKAHDAGIPLVAFDSKPPEGFPIPLEAYVGTDHNFLGRTMARLLKQLKPEGGDFGIVFTPAFDERVDGFRDEIFKDNDRDDRAHWYEVDLPILSYDLPNGIDQFHRFMEMLAQQDPTAIIFMYQTPMRAENYTDFIDEHRHRDILYLGTDGSQYQLEYLNRRYVDGLVGQLPYDMGAFSAEILHNAAAKKKEEALTAKDTREADIDHQSNEIVLDIPELPLVPTNLVAYNLIPIELPPVEVEQSLLGPLVIAGFTCFGILILSCILCVGWTVLNRTGVVVKASQPVFLLMTISGIVLMASALIPLSYDDGGNPELLDDSFRVGICMTIPWFLFSGFTVTFAALFSKTWRVNKFFHSKSAFGRLKVSEFDVLMPFVVLLSLNFVVLICWTVIDPLTYEREFLLGTDYWNREIASVGRCRSDHAVAYLVVLALLNFLSLVISAWQAWEARDIESEFSEGKYIGLSIFSMCQAFMTGIPIIAVVKDIPEAFYLVTVFLIFMLCMVVLSLVFVPKIRIQYLYAKLPLVEQRKLLAISVRKSAFSSDNISSELSSRRISGLNVPNGLGHQGFDHSSGLNSCGPRDASGGSNQFTTSNGSTQLPACQYCGAQQKKLSASIQGFLLSGSLKLPSSEESKVRSIESSREYAIVSEADSHNPPIPEGVEKDDFSRNEAVCERQERLANDRSPDEQVVAVKTSESEDESVQHA